MTRAAVAKNELILTATLKIGHGGIRPVKLFSGICGGVTLLGDETMRMRIAKTATAQAMATAVSFDILEIIENWYETILIKRSQQGEAGFKTMRS